VALYSKGRARRERLIDAAMKLLGEHPFEAISMRHIADEAGIPPGSSYHFFSNAQEVFAALAERFGEDLIDRLTAPYRAEQTGSWQQLYCSAVDRAVQIYLENPAYIRLILGAQTPPAIKLSDRENDRKLGALFVGVLDRHFVLPKIRDFDEKVFFSIEIVDLLLSLSFIHHGELKGNMIEEGKTAATAYLERFLPVEIPRRDPGTDPTPTG